MRRTKAATTVWGASARLPLGLPRRRRWRSSRAWAGTASTSSACSSAGCAPRPSSTSRSATTAPRAAASSARCTTARRSARASWYMGYRPSFLALRALYRARRQPAALAMLWGYASAAARRVPRCPDERSCAALRERQRLGTLRRGAPAS